MRPLILDSKICSLKVTLLTVNGKGKGKKRTKKETGISDWLCRCSTSIYLYKKKEKNPLNIFHPGPLLPSVLCILGLCCNHRIWMSKSPLVWKSWNHSKETLWSCGAQKGQPGLLLTSFLQSTHYSMGSETEEHFTLLLWLQTFI